MTDPKQKNSDTLVIQSHRNPLPFPWLQRCLDSVSTWSQSYGYDYIFKNDDFFDIVPGAIKEKYQSHTVILADMARLLWINQYLTEKYDTVIWMDTDFLVFDLTLELTDESFAVGRETWIQTDKNKKLRCYKKVHNAFLMFRRGNPFLPYYIDTASRLLQLNQGQVPAQFIGPKLLTALHNISLFPVQEDAGMLSPLVIIDILQQGGKALDMFLAQSKISPKSVNLSSSLVEQYSFSNIQMEELIDRLLENRQFRT